MNKYQSRKCSIEARPKSGKTRLRLNENDLESFLTNCTIDDEEDDNELIPFYEKNVTNPIKKTS